MLYGIYFDMPNREKILYIELDEIEDKARLTNTLKDGVSSNVKVEGERAVVENSRGKFEFPIANSVLNRSVLKKMKSNSWEVDGYSDEISRKDFAKFTINHYLGHVLFAVLMLALGLSLFAILYSWITYD